jgi:hypothetical protein
MQWLIDLLRWPFKDKRTEWEVKREREFIDAVNNQYRLTLMLETAGSYSQGLSLDKGQETTKIPLVSQPLGIPEKSSPQR